jgi:septal ring factor EnvC (AmiA/AmiB activator)
VRRTLLLLALVLAWAPAAQAKEHHHHHAAPHAAAAQPNAARAAALAQKQVQAAAALRTLEDQTSQDTERLASLQAQQTAADQQLQTAQQALETLLPVMQRLAAQPATTLLATPQTPAQAVHSVAVMQGIAAAIEAQAQTVKTLSAQLAVLLANAQAAQTQLSAAVATQESADAALQGQINASKSAELADADTAARAAQAKLQSQHQLTSIGSVVTQLAPPAPTPVALPPSGGGAPVAGRIMQRYGASTLAGPAQGISYSAAPGARVTTPCAGTVIFSGPFPSYGNIVITDCGGGASVVLAGLNHVDVTTGQRLAHGQPVGSMLGYDSATPTRQPVLYVELRQNGAPVDPTAWLHGGRSG